MADQQSFQQQYLKSDTETKRLFRLNQARWNRRKETQLDMLMKENTIAENEGAMEIPEEEVNSGKRQ